MIVESKESFLFENLVVDESDLRCDDCGRSIMTRFGKGVPPSVCTSCENEFDRLNKAGKLWIEENEH